MKPSKGPFEGTLVCNQCGWVFNEYEKKAFILDIELHHDKCNRCVIEIYKRLNKNKFVSLSENMQLNLTKK